MKKIAITLVLVSGLYITKTHGATTAASATNINIEALSIEIIEAADALLIESPMSVQDQETSEAFRMELISERAAHDAEDIQNTIECEDTLQR